MADRTKPKDQGRVVITGKSRRPKIRIVFAKKGHPYIMMGNTNLTLNDAFLLADELHALALKAQSSREGGDSAML